MEYLRGKTQNHAAGSLEELVENLVKSWESEASHKVDMSQWKTVDRDAYQIQTNGGTLIEGREAMKMGNYNALMIDCPTYKSCESFLMRSYEVSLIIIQRDLVCLMILRIEISL